MTTEQEPISYYEFYMHVKNILHHYRGMGMKCDCWSSFGERGSSTVQTLEWIQREVDDFDPKKQQKKRELK